MATFTYPASDFDRPQQLLAALGSFWASAYAGNDQVQVFATARAQLEQQTYQQVLELVGSLSRFHVPIFQQDNWYFLRLRESDRNNAQVSVAKFDEANLTFNSGLTYDAARELPWHAFPLPEQLSRAALIMNRLGEPSVVLTDGIDYVLDVANGAIIFRDNPFANSLIAQRPVFDGGEVADREVGLWIFRGEFDFNTIYQQFGYVLGLKLKSSAGYRELVNAVFDALVLGPSAAQLDQALAIVSGIPLVKETQETVEQLVQDPNGVMIVTDQHVYRFDIDATPIVAVGDVVYAGDALTDALRVYEFGTGQIPDITALSLGRGLLAACYYGELLFENRDLPLEVDEQHLSGFTYVKFGLGGFPADVEAFFDDMHARGIASAALADDPCYAGRRVGTLAMLLDRRVNATGQPSASDLPATINPMGFLVQQVLRNNAFLVRIKIAGLGRNQIGLYNVRHVTRLLPPHTALLLLLELPEQSEVVKPGAFNEELSQFTGMEVVQEVPGLPQEKLRIRLVSGTCQ